MTLLELYELAEMANTRKDPSWRVLDWAAGQEGDFTIADAYRVYAAAGGQSTIQQFHTIFNRWVAKYDPRAPKDKYRDQERYGLSQSRPLVITRVGRRGTGGAASYRWGLDGPLRQPPEAGGQAPEPEADDAVGDALDRLEGHMGGVELRRVLARWRTLPDMAAVMRDVMALPARMRAEAMLVASQHLVKSGEASPAEVEDAEERLAARAAAAPAAARTPFSPGKPRTDLPQAGRPGFRPRPTPPPEEGPDDDPAAEWDETEADRTQPDAANPFAEPEADREDDGDAEGESDGTPEGASLRVVLRATASGGMSRGTATWEGGSVVVRDEGGRVIRPQRGVELQTLGDEQFDAAHSDMMEWLGANWPELLDPPSEGGPDLEAELGGPESGEEEGDGDGSEGEAGDFPEWAPRPDPEGSEAEQAMSRLVSGHGVGPDDPMWEAVAAAEDESDLRRAVMAAWRGRPKAGFRDALAVASFGLQNAFEAPEEYEDDAVGDETEPEDADADVEPEQGPDDASVEDDGGGETPEDSGPAEIPEWLPRPDEDGLGAESAMYDILTDMPAAAGFEGFDAGHPLFSELRGAEDINDAYTILMRNSVPRIMVKKFLKVVRAIFDHDGRDPDTGGRIGEARDRLIRMIESRIDADGRDVDGPPPDPSRRGPAGPARLLPIYGMDEGPNVDPVDFAPRSGLSRIMRVVGRRR